MAQVTIKVLRSAQGGENDHIMPREINQKPIGWNDDVYNSIMDSDSSGWTCSPQEMLDLIQCLGPVVKIAPLPYDNVYIHFKTLVLDVNQDDRVSGIRVTTSPATQTSPSQCKFMITHKEEDINCRLIADDLYRRDGKRIVRCLVKPRKSTPGLDSDDDMDEFQRELDEFGDIFKAKALKTPYSCTCLIQPQS